MFAALIVCMQDSLSIDFKGGSAVYFAIILAIQNYIYMCSFAWLHTHTHTHTFWLQGVDVFSLWPASFMVSPLNFDCPLSLSG